MKLQKGKMKVKSRWHEKEAAWPAESMRANFNASEIQLLGQNKAQHVP